MNIGCIELYLKYLVKFKTSVELKYMARITQKAIENKWN